MSNEMNTRVEYIIFLILGGIKVYKESTTPLYTLLENGFYLSYLNTIIGH